MIFDLACIDVCVFLNHRLIGGNFTQGYYRSYLSTAKELE